MASSSLKRLWSSEDCLNFICVSETTFAGDVIPLLATQAEKVLHSQFVERWSRSSENVTLNIIVL